MADEIETELDLLIAERQHVQTVARLKAACKTAAADDPIRDEYRAAKLAHRAFKQTWRGVRRLQQDAAIEGGDAAAILAMVGEGGAVAAPVTVGLTSNVQEA